MIQTATDSHLILRVILACTIIIFGLLALKPAWSASGYPGKPLADQPKSVSASKTKPTESQAPKSKSSALLIGNQSYPWGPLETPISDISAISDNLEKIGFQVQQVRNAGQNELYSAIDSFIRANRDSETLLFFYAGHAIQLNGRNYLIPVDTLIDDPDLLSKLFDIRYLLDALETIDSKTRIVIFDACRSNPFSALPKASSGLSELVAPANTLVAFSTAPGNTAEDGDSNHSPYTLGLLKYLFMPQVRIEDSFKSVRRFVRLATENRQVPWENTSLENEFILSDAARGSSAQSSAKSLNSRAAGKPAGADPKLCKSIFTKYSLGTIPLTPEESAALPLCK